MHIMVTFLLNALAHADTKLMLSGIEYVCMFEYIYVCILIFALYIRRSIYH